MDRTESHVPGVARTVALLDFLATRPGEAFSVSELARRLGLHKSTLHSTVTTLVHAGYLARLPVEKTYTLGPALVAIGEAAADRPRADPMQHARVEMRAVSDELGVQCVAFTIIGTAVDSEIVIVAHTGTSEPLGERLDIGQRLPLTPPLATVFVAWRPAADVDAWIRGLRPRVTASDRARYRRALDAVRRRGYSVVLATAPRSGSNGTPGGVPGRDEQVLLELDGSVDSRLSLVGAPVFGDDGRPVMAIAAFGLADPLDPSEVARAGERLRSAAAAVTRAVDGRAPDDAEDPRAS